MKFQELLEYKLISIGDYSVTLFHLIQVSVLVLISWIIIWMARRIIKKQIRSGRFDEGRGDAFFQILRYVIIVIALFLGLDAVGVKLTLLLAGSAALLVGIGLGLQQIFNDIVSGVLLLFEGTISIGDIVEVNNIVGKVKRIAIRTSKIETRDRIIIIVPNSKLANDNVINWSHNRVLTRFNVTVGVAYGSDVKLVMQVLQQAAMEHPDVAKNPEPQARFIDFGESSLDFELLFYSSKMFEIEFVRSDIRVIIDRKFRENNVTIPFPQRDLHLKTAIPLPVRNG